MLVICPGWPPLSCIWYHWSIVLNSRRLHLQHPLDHTGGSLQGWLSLNLFSTSLRTNKDIRFISLTSLGPWKTLQGNAYPFTVNVPGSLSGTRLGRGDLSEAFDLLNSNLEIRHSSPCSQNVKDPHSCQRSACGEGRSRVQEPLSGTPQGPPLLALL